MSAAPVQFGALYRLQFNPGSRVANKIPMSVAAGFANRVAVEWSEQNGHQNADAFLMAYGTEPEGSHPNASESIKDCDFFIATDEGEEDTTWSDYMYGEVLSGMFQGYGPSSSDPVERMIANRSNPFLREFIISRVFDSKTINVLYQSVFATDKNPNYHLRSWNATNEPDCFIP